jgi:hypothetical protein
VSGDKPIWCTEAGYTTEGKVGRAVPDDIQALYLTRMLLLHFKAGIQRTYLYQLADHGKDEGGSMGLLDDQGREKPAFRAIAGLMAELSDESARPDTSAQFTVEGALEDVQGAAFAKADGTFRLLLWLEKPSFDVKAARPLEVPRQSVELQMPAGWKARRLLTLASDGQWQPADVQRAGTVTLSVSDRPLMLDVARGKS